MFSTLLMLVAIAPSPADEGMWLPEQLPQMSELLTEMGLAVPAADFADLGAAPLGAIISTGGCTASFLSKDGLVITNRHCATRYLRAISDEDNDRLEAGFVADSRASEPSVGLSARLWIVTGTEDVTEQVKRKLGPRLLGDAARQARLERLESELVADCEAPDEAGRSSRCFFTELYDGVNYQLVTTTELRDVRMVYAPPRGLANFGGDVDNWQWPRHSADFAMVRAYVGPDGEPADFAPENVPYQPPRWLTPSTEGVGPGDFVAAAGYPGGTDRYARASELLFHIETVYPAELTMRDELIAALEAEIVAAPEAAARIQPTIGSIGNYRKNFQGMLDAFDRPGVLDIKLSQEADLESWFLENPQQSDRWLEAVDELEVRLDMARTTWEPEWLARRLLRSGELLNHAHTAVRFATERERPDLQREPGYQDRDLERAGHRAAALDQSLWLPADRATMSIVLTRVQALPDDQRIAPLDAWLEQRGGLEPALELLFDEPTLVDRDARLALLGADLSELERSEDPWVTLAVALESWLSERRKEQELLAGAKLRLVPKYMQGLRAHSGGLMYPDANSTLRVTVGHVEGYSPLEALLYTPQTTLAGMVAKVGEPPFDAPVAYVEAAASGTASRWADPSLGDVPVNFLTTLDITGGNSGSPVLDARGQLVGLVFDGNYESISADWVFEPDITRGICVDIRYLYWSLEVAGAAALLEELGV